MTFAAVTSVEVTFGKVAFTYVFYGEVTIGEVAFGNVTHGDVTICREYHLAGFLSSLDIQSPYKQASQIKQFNPIINKFTVLINSNRIQKH